MKGNAALWNHANIIPHLLAVLVAIYLDRLLGLKCQVRGGWWEQTVFEKVLEKNLWKLMVVNKAQFNYTRCVVTQSLDNLWLATCLCPLHYMHPDCLQKSDIWRGIYYLPPGVRTLERDSLL